MVSQHVRLEELQAFALDDEPLRPAARQHLASCPVCQEQIADIQRATSYLFVQLYRSQCPSASMLSYYCLPGALSEEEQSQVASHLTMCPLCLAEFAETRQFLDTSE